ncbi:MAG: hypothetical protein SynsKO_12930 [Synoicihabitans sp.]
MIHVVHPHGNAFVRELLESLVESEMLHTYHTTIGFRPDAHWISMLPQALEREIKRRSYALPSDRMITQPWREAVRHLARPLGLSWLTRHESGWASVDRVYQELDRAVARRLDRNGRTASAIYAYEDGALASFESAHQRGLKRIYDLPIGYWREAQRIFTEEAELQPAWSATLGGLNDSSQKLAQKDRELDLSSHVVVASEFTRSTLQRFPRKLAAQVSVIPYGAPAAISETNLKERLLQRSDGPLRVLFIGGLSQRKGLSYLFESIAQLGSTAELTVVGRPAGSSCAALEKGLAATNYYPSLPHSELFQLMENQDVLVLPSLFEGFGLVLLEAMAKGLPIVATEHTAAPDFISSAQEGIIVPIRDADALAQAFLDLSEDRSRRESMALNARNLAAQLNWRSYRKSISRLLRSVC